MKKSKASNPVDNDRLVFFWFLRQRQILEKGLSKYSPKDRLTGLVNLPLIESIVDSCVSLEPLYEGAKLRDSFSIARCICETAINIAYIEAEGERAAEQMLRYTSQREFRDLRRELKVGATSFVLSHRGTPKASENLKLAIDEYTNKNGREITAWCDKPIQMRLEAIGRVFREPVMAQIAMPYFSIYRTASDVLHGTLYGIFSTLGARRKTEERERHQRDNFTMLFFMLGNVMSAVSEVLISKKVFPPMTKERRSVRNLLKQMNFDAGS